MNNEIEKMKQPFFTMVLPVYNVEKYLDRCIESILEQNFTSYEIILVDDGSKDSCPSMCDEWSQKDSRIRVIHKKNAGLGYARNTGLEAARGEYIFFIDSDDYILPETLQTVHNTIKREQAEAVFYGFKRVDKNDKIVYEQKPAPPKTYYNNSEEIKNELLPDIIARNPYSGISINLRVSAWNCCINVEFLRKNGLKFVSEREYISEDIYFYIELFACLQRISIIERMFYCYCQNEGSLTLSYKPNRFDSLKDFYKEMEHKSNLLGYSGQVQMRLKESFIASVMGCLKMEAASFFKEGFVKSYHRVRTISKDSFLIKVIDEYPLDKYEKTWKIFAYCIRKQFHFPLYIILLLKYYTKGV